LWDAYGIALSADSLSRYIRHYQIMLAARQEDPALAVPRARRSRCTSS
jgi:hypothetical protein